MAYIDKIIDGMVAQGISRVKMVGDQPIIFIKDKQQISGSVVSAAAVEKTVREIIPFDLLPLLAQNAACSFRYQSPMGAFFKIQCDRKAGVLNVAVTPDTSSPGSGATAPPPRDGFYKALKKYLCQNADKPSLTARDTTYIANVFSVETTTVAGVLAQLEQDGVIAPADRLGNYRFLHPSSPELLQPVVSMVIVVSKARRDVVWEPEPVEIEQTMIELQEHPSRLFALLPLDWDVHLNGRYSNHKRLHPYDIDVHIGEECISANRVPLPAVLALFNLYRRGERDALRSALQQFLSDQAKDDADSAPQVFRECEFRAYLLTGKIINSSSTDSIPKVVRQLATGDATKIIFHETYKLFPNITVEAKIDPDNKNVKILSVRSTDHSAEVKGNRIRVTYENENLSESDIIEIFQQFVSEKDSWKAKLNYQCPKCVQFLGVPVEVKGGLNSCPNCKHRPDYWLSEYQAEASLEREQTYRICGSCGELGLPKDYAKGQDWVGYLLLLLFCFPGFIYLLWNSSTKYSGCAECGGKEILGLESPMGKKLIEQYYPDGIEERLTRTWG